MSTITRQKPIPNEGYYINRSIPSRTMTVIDAEGSNLGVKDRDTAIMLAEAAGLDLVQVGEKDGVAITKIMDFGKFLYEKKKQAGKSKKNQKIIQIKEIKMRPKIGPGDYQIKITQAAGFLEEGKRVKFTLQFRGRQPVSVQEVGTNFFERIKNDLVAKGFAQLQEEKEVRSPGMWAKIFFTK